MQQSSPNTLGLLGPSSNTHGLLGPSLHTRRSILIPATEQHDTEANMHTSLRVNGPSGQRPRSPTRSPELEYPSAEEPIRQPTPEESIQQPTSFLGCIPLTVRQFFTAEGREARHTAGIFLRLAFCLVQVVAIAVILALSRSRFRSKSGPSVSEFEDCNKLGIWNALWATRAVIGSGMITWELTRYLKRRRVEDQRQGTADIVLKSMGLVDKEELHLERGTREIEYRQESKPMPSNSAPIPNPDMLSSLLGRDRTPISLLEHRLSTLPPEPRLSTPRPEGPPIPLPEHRRSTPPPGDRPSALPSEPCSPMAPSEDRLPTPSAEEHHSTPVTEDPSISLPEAQVSTPPLGDTLPPEPCLSTPPPGDPSIPLPERLQATPPAKERTPISLDGDPPIPLPEDRQSTPPEDRPSALPPAPRSSIPPPEDRPPTPSAEEQHSNPLPEDPSISLPEAQVSTPPLGDTLPPEPCLSTPPPGDPSIPLPERLQATPPAKERTPTSLDGDPPIPLPEDRQSTPPEDRPSALPPAPRSSIPPPEDRPPTPSAEEQHSNPLPEDPSISLPEAQVSTPPLGDTLPPEPCLSTPPPEDPSIPLPERLQATPPAKERTPTSLDGDPPIPLPEDRQSTPPEDRPSALPPAPRSSIPPPEDRPPTPSAKEQHFNPLPEDPSISLPEAHLSTPPLGDTLPPKPCLSTPPPKDLSIPLPERWQATPPARERTPTSLDEDPPIPLPEDRQSTPPEDRPPALPPAPRSSIPPPKDRPPTPSAEEQHSNPLPEDPSISLPEARRSTSPLEDTIPRTPRLSTPPPKDPSTPLPERRQATPPAKNQPPTSPDGDPPIPLPEGRQSTPSPEDRPSIPLPIPVLRMSVSSPADLPLPLPQDGQSARREAPPGADVLFDRLDTLFTGTGIIHFAVNQIWLFTTVNTCRINNPHVWYLGLAIASLGYLIVLELLLIAFISLLDPILFLLLHLITFLLNWTARTDRHGNVIVRPEIPKMEQALVDKIPLVIYIPPPETPSEVSEEPNGLYETPSQDGEGSENLTGKANAAAVEDAPVASVTTASRRRFAWIRKDGVNGMSPKPTMWSDAKFISKGDPRFEKSEYPFVVLESNRTMCCICLFDFSEPRRKEAVPRKDLEPIAEMVEEQGSMPPVEDEDNDAIERDPTNHTVNVSKGKEPIRDCIAEAVPEDKDDLTDPGEPLRLLACGHVFHKRCLDPWLSKESGRCPVCNLKVDIPKYM